MRSISQSGLPSMVARDLGYLEPDSAAWYAARQERIGGSDIGAICGWSPYADREAIMSRKLETQVPPDKLSKGKDRGKRLEDAVVGWMLDKTNAELDKTALHHTFVDVDRDWMLFNPDALATVKGEKAIFEAKTTAERSEERGWGRAGTDKFPLGYQAQCMWGMGILGYETAYLGVLGGTHNGRPDLGFALYKIKFDKDLFMRLVQKGEEFINEMNERKELLWA